MKDEEGNTLKSCDNHGGLKTLPRNAMECEKLLPQEKDFLPPGWLFGNEASPQQAAGYHKEGHCL